MDMSETRMGSSPICVGRRSQVFQPRPNLTNRSDSGAGHNELRLQRIELFGPGQGCAFEERLRRGLGLSVILCAGHIMRTDDHGYADEEETHI